MSQIVFSRNLFLEKEELTRFQLFLQESTVNRLFLQNTSVWGVVEDQDNPNASFLVEVGTNAGTIKITTQSYAADSAGDLILQAAFDNLAVTNDSNYYWVKIAYEATKPEIGTVSVDLNGTLTGVGTLFTDVLRGSATLEVPTKIKFFKEAGGLVNTGIYDVVSLTNDTTALLTGSFTPEGGLSYIVIGTYTLGEPLTSTQEDGLYDYDNCSLTLVAETVSDTPPAGLVADMEFYISRVINTAGTVTVEDKRTEYWTFFLGGSLLAVNNLSDLINIATARTNISVYSKAEVDAFFAPVAITPITPQNGWTLSGSDAGFYKDVLGVIHLRGYLNGVSASNAIAFTLPVGYRPNKLRGFALSVGVGDAIHTATLNTAGNFSIITFNVAPLDYLDGITFNTVI